MKRILIIGAGKIGETIALLLAREGGFDLTLADRDEQCLARIAERIPITTARIDAEDPRALRDALAGMDAVIGACPYFLTLNIAEAARQAGVHYLDLTEDVRATARVKELAENAPSAFIPQCGLAPGFISIAANDLAGRFDELDQISMRVGALPKYPTNALKYNLTWSTEGLINEYCEPCQAIMEGKLTTTIPLEGLEEFSLDGIRYEAFNTSGGPGTLCETYAGRVRSMNYRSVRYPGHRGVMRMLLNDLRLSDHRDLLKQILEAAIPATMQDVVLVFVTASGMRAGRLVQETYARKIYGQELAGERLSAIQITTASAVCAVLDLLLDGRIPGHGLVRQEDIDFSLFLDNRFAAPYARASLAAPAPADLTRAA